MRNLEIKNIDCRAALEMTKNAQSGRCLLPESGADAPTVLSAVYTDSTPAKNRQADVPQYGRSMIEMLGVLAIIGVLSVGGIAGYSKAMMKYRINKTIEQITLLMTNIRTFFAPQRNYEGSSNFTVLHKAKIVPEEMWGTIEVMNETYETINHPFDNEIAIFTSNKTSTSTIVDAVVFEMYGIPQEACIEIATMDWRANSGNSMIYITVNGTSIEETQEQYTDSCTTNARVTCAKDMPMSIDVATTACEDVNLIDIKFY